MFDVKDTVLVVDDEPMFLDWLEDFLSSKNYKTKFITNVSDALNVVSTTRFRALVVDLNIPASADLIKAIEDKGAIFSQYRGLFVAEKARSSGYRDRQVIVYSVHSDEGVKEVADRLGVVYITKGRPHIFKAEIESVLEYDPTEK